MNNKVSVGALAVALLALGVSYFAPSTSTVVNNTKEVIQDGVGAIPGLDVTSDGLTINGLKVTYTRQSFKQGTSTICAIPKPQRATSTLLFLGANFKQAYSTSVKGSWIDFAVIAEDTATSSAFATTSANVIGTPYNLSRGNAKVVNASSSIGEAANALADANNFAYAAVVMSNQAAGDYRGYAPVGDCQAIWIVQE